MAEKFKQIGEKYGKTSTQVAIAWVLSQPKVICALTGSSNIAHLEENVKGSDWTISSDDLEDIELFLKEEDKWLRQKQISSINNILLNPLPEETSKAIADLVYVIETAILLGLTSEDKILPIFYELYEIRKSLNENSIKKLEVIQNQLKSLIL